MVDLGNGSGVGAAGHYPFIERMNMNANLQTRLLCMARQLAEVHLQDNDDLGHIANELIKIIDENYPEIQELPELD